MKSSLKVLIALSIVLTAIPVMASNFRAADVVYLPAAGRLQGQAFFKTDIVVTNVSNAAVTVDAALLEGASGADAGLDAFERVATLDAGESIFIEDAILEIFGRNGFGQMIFQSCRVGGDCVETCETGDCLPIVVEGRVYAESTDPAICGEAPTCTFGQLFSGLPWYSYVSSGVADRGLDEVWITGIQQNEQYRSNVGFANASEFSITTLNVSLYNNDGTLFGTTEVTLGPVGHVQRPITGGANPLFPGFTGGGYVVVQQPASGVIPTEPDNEDPFFASGAPGFYTYGSVLDNATDDPTTLEAVYPVEFDYLSVYGPQKMGNEDVRRLVRRPGSR